MLVIHDEHDSYHGKNVAAIARETYLGPMEIVENPGNGLNADVVADYIREWADKGAKVYNLSYGAGNNTTYCEVTPKLTEALKYAYLKGMTVVFAGGNMGFHNQGASGLASGLWSIDCGGLDTDGATVGEYSQYHPALIEYYAKGYYQGASGTSYAAPRLSAYIALVQEAAGWSLNSCQVRSHLLESAVYFPFKDVWLSRLGPAKRPQGITARLKVAALYALYLQRQPDQNGYLYWVPRVEKEGILDMAVAFKNSPEYEKAKRDEATTDFVPAMRQVQAMYHLFLQREADPEGCAYWAEELLKTANPDTNIRTIAERFINGARNSGENIDERLLF